MTELYLFVSDSGAKSWVLRTVVGSKRRHIGLDGFPSVTLAHAKDKAREYRALIASGQDPVLLRQTAKAALKSQQANTRSFEACALAYIETKQIEWKNTKHRNQWLRTLQMYAFPVMGSLTVGQLGLAEVLAVLEPIWISKTETASRLLGRLESILDWATVRGYRSGLNPAR